MREYCTPGSVRGAPGNRCPYLDISKQKLRNGGDKVAAKRRTKAGSAVADRNEPAAISHPEVGEGLAAVVADAGEF